MASRVYSPWLRLPFQRGDDPLGTSLGKVLDWVPLV